MAAPRPARIVEAVRDARDIVDRLRALAADAEQAEQRASDLSDIEDVLATGYAGALSGEARMLRLERELDELIDTAADGRGRDVRQLVGERRALERSIAQLRAALARLHAHFVALGGAVPRS